MGLEKRCEKKQEMSSLKDRLKSLCGLAGSLPPEPPPRIAPFTSVAFPVIRRAHGGGEPLRRNIDYQSQSRKTFLTDILTGFHCGKCGFAHDDEGYVHSEDECAVAGIMLS